MEPLIIKEIVQAVDGELLAGDENQSISFVGTNSGKMEENSLFVPIIGEKVDGHSFIEDAFLHGSIACFTNRELDYKEGQTYIRVKDTLKALQALGTYYRSKFDIPIIGITGSVGKTTTKEMIAAALSTKKNILKTEGNMNSQVGLPLMMFKLKKEHEIGIIEMGMSEEGEMARLTAIAKPEVAVMTNIGVSHIAQLKTRENIRKEKLNIINEFQKSSVLFLNGNDELLNEIKDGRKDSYQGIDMSKDTKEKLLNCEVITFGTLDNCEFSAIDIKTIHGETHFKVKVNNYMEDNAVLAAVEDAAEYEEEVILKVLGIHNVYNALAALAVANYYGISIKTAKEGLKNYQPIAMRGQIKEVNGLKIIDDSYNASPDSMKSGIHVLNALEGVKRRIAVLADVLELGEISKQSHYEVGEYIDSQNIDCVVTVGKEAFYIGKALIDKVSKTQVYSFYHNADAIQFLLEYVMPGDGVLVKGSRGMKTDEIVNGLCGAN